MTDTPSTTPGDETRPLGGAAGPQTLDPGAVPPEAGVQPGPASSPPPYAGPHGAPYDRPPPGYPPYQGYPGYPPPPRPRFTDQVLGMRAVIAVALVALVIGGLGGALLGALARGGTDDRFGGPGGFPRQGFGQPPNQGQLPNQQFGQNGP